MSEHISEGSAWPIATWLSVVSLTFGSFALISSELLPMAVLTPMAADLGVTEGAAGQAVTLTALFAGIAAPTVALIIGRLDRKLINLALCALVIVSNIAVALTSDYFVLLAARMLLGIAIGGFFALAGATVVRLVTMEDMGKGMSIVFMGLSAGLVVAPALATLSAKLSAGARHSWPPPDAVCSRCFCKLSSCRVCQRPAQRACRACSAC